MVATGVGCHVTGWGAQPRRTGAAKGESGLFPGVTTQRPPRYAHTAEACELGDKLIYPRLGLAGWPLFNPRLSLPLCLPSLSFSFPAELLHCTQQQQTVLLRSITKERRHKYILIYWRPTYYTPMHAGLV